MKILSLYIDKWYIVGSILDGANRQHLSLNNAEDRIWLYFWSNRTVNKVSYGLNYKDGALDGKSGYYKDIFDLLPDYKEYYYEKYGSRKMMNGIFEDSGIFEDLKKSYGKQAEIPVYVSFSDDIDIVSQQIFIEAISRNGFVVKQFTEPIEILAVEYLERKNRISNAEYILLANACNENLIYSICKRENEYAKIVSRERENGYGVDSREQAVVEEVLEYLQDATRFLYCDKDWEEERLYLSQFAGEWLKILDTSPEYVPVSLGNVHFKKQSGNDVPVSIECGQITDRTKNIIEQLSSKANDLIDRNNLLTSNVSHIILLGDVFSNKTFQNTLQRRIGLEESNIIWIPESELSEVVGIYVVWKENTFADKRNKQIEVARNKYKQDQRRAIEEKTQELKELGKEAEDEDRLQDAIEYYASVLKIDASDQFSLTRKRQLITELQRREQDKSKVDRLLIRARQSFDGKKYEEAIRCCCEILRIQRNNSVAKDINDQSNFQLKRLQQFESYIEKINEYIAKEEYYKARDILQRVDDDNFNDVRINDVREKIEIGIIKIDTIVRDLTSKFDDAYRLEDYKSCLLICDELLALDIDSFKWAEQKRIISCLQQSEEKFIDNRELARKARLEGNWKDVVSYAQSALSLKADSEIVGWLKDAEIKIQNDESTRIQDAFLEAAAQENWEEVISLYNVHGFLCKKSSNATWYGKAKKALKDKTASYHIRVKNDIIPHTNDINVGIKKTTIHQPFVNFAGRPKSGPTRPKVSHRPKIHDIIENPIDDKNKKKLRVDSSSQEISETGGSSKKIDTIAPQVKTSRIKINNKPKR